MWLDVPQCQTGGAGRAGDGARSDRPSARRPAPRKGRGCAGRSGRGRRNRGGWPTWTPCCAARRSAARAVAASPAWNPQETFAVVISGINSASCGQPSPRSQFRSRYMHHPCHGWRGERWTHRQWPANGPAALAVSTRAADRGVVQVPPAKRCGRGQIVYVNLSEISTNLLSVNSPAGFFL